MTRMLLMAAMLALAQAGCSSWRVPAKTNVATAAMEEFESLHDLLRALPPDEEMRQRHPSLQRTPGRIAAEQRNVAVEAWVYAVARELDGDYHLVLGSRPEPPAEFMTAEVTWVPSKSVERAALLAPQEQFRAIFGHPFWWGNYVRSKPPVHVRITGSLFYDIDHRPGHVGPRQYASGTAWEIHPVTSISVVRATGIH